MDPLTDLSQVQWRKGSRSSSTGSDCVEVATIGDVVAVRDSKLPEGAPVFTDRRTWRELTQRAAGGEFDV